MGLSPAKSAGSRGSVPHFSPYDKKNFFDTEVCGEFRSPERPTFVNSDKSRQKHRKEPPVPSPPGALHLALYHCDNSSFAVEIKMDATAA